MKKSHVINLLDERIAYYTGGEMMKSIAESVCDSRIIDELKHIKSELETKNK